MVDQEIIDLPNDDGMPADLSLFLPLQITPGSTRRRSLSNVLSNTGALATRTVHVSSEQDLVDEFGTNIIIPDGEAITIFLDDSFVLSKPFKIGDNSSLELEAPVIKTELNYTGTGALFQNENPANPIEFLFSNSVTFIGDGTNSLFDIVCSNLVFVREFTAINFDSAGVIESQLAELNSGIFAVLNKGIIFKNVEALNFINVSVRNTTPSSPPLTFFTVISTIPTLVQMRDCFILDTGATVVFFDPNAPAGSSFIIQNTSILFANLFQQGLSKIITGVADNGSGQCRFTTIDPHGLVEGKATVLSGFVTQTTYNQTGIVLGVPVSATEFDVDIPFIATDTGNENPASLDSTDVAVASRDNVGSPDSMFTSNSGLEIFGSEVTTTINTINVPEVVTSASWASVALERFIDGTVNQGQVIAQDIALRRYTIEFSGTIEKSGGGSVNVGLVILKNGTNVSFNPPHTVNTGKIQIGGQDIIELTKDDTIDVAVINFADTSNIIVSQLSLVINLA